MNLSEQSGQSATFRSIGVTRAERYLQQLCERTFLSLWSYPGIYRDQGRGDSTGHGKEVCDLLVIFENHVIIFSDKACVFPNSGNLDLDWSRWFRRAVESSAKQVWGAERWIRTMPELLFLDRACTQPFPIPLPDPSNAVFHRIIVAHDSSTRCRAELGGSGSLMITPHIVGEMHYITAAKGGIPFAIGQVNPEKGFVHVLDDTTLDILLGTLDTVTDFVSYLMKKEQFVSRGGLIAAAGEEELLAFYLKDINTDDEHDFILPRGINKLMLDEGEWATFAHSGQRKAQVSANKVSYAWDALIESFNRHAFAGTQYFTTHQGLAHHNQIVRFLAREPRTRRRMLARSLLELMADSARGLRRVRVSTSSRVGDPHYIFLVLEQPDSVDYDEYRRVRRELLHAYCLVVKRRFPVALDIIGIATEPPAADMATSEDVMYLDAREFPPDQQAEAERLQHELGLLLDVNMSMGTELEYPILTKDNKIKPTLVKQVTMKGRNRNERCLCGSGKKFKYCCGK